MRLESLTITADGKVTSDQARRGAGGNSPVIENAHSFRLENVVIGWLWPTKAQE